ncbi:DUF418 domain-containing protein [Pseudonocardia humida]|uniref:DUF418 domain-containing protein n=1 Tax=Pseudonocardia humida TaxID=2800819 RepID=A0ABT1A0L4_9PSEU|nr:DUF418 domain-containing protein [Pseudonocardia humida]MCO1656548.1 DUF418 domain-containing protein [Pseudonocardia humida]
MSLPGAPHTLPAAARSRILALDVVRGVALCGILLVNVRPIAAAVDAPADPEWFALLAQQRFYVIFSLLFGIGFALLVDSAAARTATPRLVLLRRLLALLVVGLAHRFGLWGGEILTVYALVGLVVLLPSTWLPRWAVAVLAGFVCAAGLVIGGGGPVLIAGLFLAGAALVRYGVIDRLDRDLPAVALAGAAFAVLAVPAVWWQVAVGDDADDPAGTHARGVAGLLVAGVYVCVLLVLLRTPLRRPLAAAFAPLGRMALTNYLSATAAVLLVVAVVGHPERWSTKAVLTIVAVVLVVQWVFSALWLRRFRQGPLEWLWRWATWARRPALLR